MSAPRPVPLVLAALVVALMLPASASAKPKPPACAAPTSGQFEQPFEDGLNYVLVPGGDFEGSTWKPGKAAQENEPDLVSGATDSRSLTVSGVSSPEMCLGIESPTLRFFARQVSGPIIATLTVETVFRDASGMRQRLPVAWAPDKVLSGGWVRSAPAPIFGASLLRPLSAGTITSPLDSNPIDVGTLSFAFTASMGSTWRIDDVYVDPYRRN